MRVTNGVARRARKKRIMKAAKGFWGRRNRLLRTAIEAVHNAEKSATRDRKRRKRDFRRIWITRISAACRTGGVNYSRFIAGLVKLENKLDRKSLSTLAIESPAAFAALVEQSKAALAKA